LEDENIFEIGTNRRPEDFGKGRIFEKNGIKLGFASATFGLNGRELPANEFYRINVCKLNSKFLEPELDLIKQQIDDCKNQNCDFIIASLHWGFEFEFFPREKQIKIAHDLVEWGADAIIAHHPHVLQPVEHYSTYRDPHRIAVIAYSLGSLNLPFSAPHIALSGILNLTLSKGKVQGKSITYIEKSHITPVFSQSVELNGKRVMRLQKLMTNLSTDLKTEEKNYLKKIKQYADLVMRT
jgi:poly-gamma-glutamate synthesis protein (capsule biosynthesis protein)